MVNKIGWAILDAEHIYIIVQLMENIAQAYVPLGIQNENFAKLNVTKLKYCLLCFFSVAIVYE